MTRAPSPTPSRGDGTDSAATPDDAGSVASPVVSGRFYLTTPIYYVNAKPHLGHAYTTIVGDALARWHRLLGEEVHFLTGTDEHGLKIQQAAEAAGLTPQAFADSIAPQFVEAWQRLDISNDDFIRTTEPRHKVAVAKLLQACYDAGDIELGTYSGLYCVACEEYYTEDELIDDPPGETLCPIHKRPVDHFEEENYFFRLSRFEDRLLDLYDDASRRDRAEPSPQRGDRADQVRTPRLLGVAHQPRSGASRCRGTRSTSPTCGSTPSPTTSPPSATAATTSGSPTWWPVDYHLIGKDIIRHHCVYWPAMLMSAGVEPPKGWAVGGWLLSGGEKMSKTSGNVVNPLDLIDDIGVDGFRYYVLADTPYGADGDFTYEGLIARYNSDLANNLGNLLVACRHGRRQEVRRRRSGSVARQPARRPGAAEPSRPRSKAWDSVQPSRALEATWSLIRATNAYLETNEPWKAEPGPALDG